jgi:predicted CXXCH cytochrome family protein
MYKKNAGVPERQSEVSQDGSEKAPEGAASEIYLHSLPDLQKCQTCHKPHFSEELALIVEPIQPLCNRCHDYKETAFSKAHINIDSEVMDCRNCHDPHTSTDPMFFKAEIHKPFADRVCKDCHFVERP